MSHIKPLIAELQARLTEEEGKLAEAQAAVLKTKIGINVLCDLGGDPPMFPDASATSIVSAPSAASAGPVVKPDQYFNRPQATCVREILEQRKRQNPSFGPMSLNEIHSALKAGGYSFDARDDETAKRGLSISIAKNTALFARLPNDLIGLTDWYGGPKRKGKGKENGDTDASQEVDSGVSAGGEPS